MSHAARDETIVLCEDAAKERRYVTAAEWEECVERFSIMAADQGIVTSESSNEEKVALFRSFFKGRTDVYNKGYRRKDGGIGYTPACAHEWDGRLCDKRRTKCADCPNRRFLPLTDGVLRQHFQERNENFSDVVGLFPIDQDFKVRFIVVDFDKEGWEDEVAAYRQACEGASIPVAVERFRSGNGSHAWIFFEEPVNAGFARNVGSAITTAAMAKTGAVSFRENQ